jgi:hypothetical protein
MIGYLVPNTSIRESTVDLSLNPMIDTGHVRPNLSGLDRLPLPMGGTQAATAPGSQPARRREIDLALGAFPDRPRGTTTYAYPEFRRCPAAPARTRRRLHLRLLRLPGRPSDLLRPAPLPHTDVAGGPGPRRDPALAQRPRPGVAPQRSHPRGGPTLGHPNRGQLDPVLPVGRGDCGTRCRAPRFHSTPHPDRRTSI